MAETTISRKGILPAIMAKKEQKRLATLQEQQQDTENLRDLKPSKSYPNDAMPRSKSNHHTTYNSYGHSQTRSHSQEHNLFQSHYQLQPSAPQKHEHVNTVPGLTMGYSIDNYYHPLRSYSVQREGTSSKHSKIICGDQLVFTTNLHSGFSKKGLKIRQSSKSNKGVVIGEVRFPRFSGSMKICFGNPSDGKSKWVDLDGHPLISKSDDYDFEVSLPGICHQELFSWKRVRDTDGPADSLSSYHLKLVDSKGQPVARFLKKNSAAGEEGRFEIYKDFGGNQSDFVVILSGLGIRENVRQQKKRQGKKGDVQWEFYDSDYGGVERGDRGDGGNVGDCREDAGNGGGDAGGDGNGDGAVCDGGGGDSGGGGDTGGGDSGGGGGGGGDTC